MKKQFIILLVLTAVIMTLAGCKGCVSTKQDETEFEASNSQTVESSQAFPTIDDIETTENVMPDFYENVFEKDREIENVFNILDNNNVEEEHFENFDKLLDYIEDTGYGELKLFQHTKKDTVRIGKEGSVLVGQFAVSEDPIVWNFRAEKADGHSNHSGIVIPEHWESQEYDNTVGATSVLTTWLMDKEKGLWTEIWTFYFPKTQHLYTFYSDNVSAEYYTRAPGVVVQTFYDPQGKAMGREWYTD